jgi:hypothetical protein
MAVSAAQRLASLSEAEAARLLDFYNQAQAELLDAIMAAQARGASGTALQLTELEAQVRGIIETIRTGNAQWAQEATEVLYGAAVDYADELSGLGGTAIGGVPIHTAALEALAANTYTGLDAMVERLGRRTDDFFRQAQLEQARSALIGADTVDSFARKLAERLAQAGVLDDTGSWLTFVDAAGKRWHIRSYTQMVGRSLVREAQTMGAANRYVELGVAFGIIGSHSTPGMRVLTGRTASGRAKRGTKRYPSPCELCSPWEGRVIDLTGQDPDLPTLADAKAGGVFHPNCKHVLRPHVVDPGDAAVAATKAWWS